MSLISIFPSNADAFFTKDHKVAWLYNFMIPRANIALFADHFEVQLVNGQKHYMPNPNGWPVVEKICNFFRESDETIQTDFTRVVPDNDTFVLSNDKKIVMVANHIIPRNHIEYMGCNSTHVTVKVRHCDPVFAVQTQHSFQAQKLVQVFLQG